MKLRLAHLLALCALTIIFAAPAIAQADESEKFSVGLGAGITQTDIGSQPYWMLNARFRAGYRSTGEEHKGAITGFVEPEIGYWSGDEDTLVGNTVVNVDESDLLVGVNVGGAVRLKNVEFFLGGGAGCHFINRDVGAVSQDDNKIGVDAQFGFDLLMTETVSIFGVGRFDLIQDAPNASQGKAYVGVRFHF